MYWPNFDKVGRTAGIWSWNKMGDEREGHKLAETLNSKSSLKEKLDIK